MIKMYREKVDVDWNGTRDLVDVSDQVTRANRTVMDLVPGKDYHEVHQIESFLSNDLHFAIVLVCVGLLTGTMGVLFADWMGWI